MTQKYADDGTVIPVTKVLAGPCVVSQVKTEKKDGYTAVQVGFGNKKKLKKPQAGQLKKIGKNLRWLKEFRLGNGDELKGLKAGDEIAVEIFKPGDIVDVVGISKGKGFQGVVKRHGFAGAPKTHGTKDALRMPGSIGATTPQHVFKGVRMAGRMGGDRVTVKNLEIVEVDLQNNWLYIKGAVPGARGGLVMVKGRGRSLKH